MVSPFTDDGALNLAAAVDLAKHLQANGSESLVVTGTTGESPVLTDDERIELWREVAGAVTIPVIAGATTNDTAHSLNLVAEAQAAGVAAILAVTPYYNRPSQEGLGRHFAAVADATSLPVLLYDIPIRTGRKIATETMVRLAHTHPNIVGVKDAAGDPPGTARLIAQAPSGFEVYSGDDVSTLPLLAVGAVGVIGVATHWAGPEIAEMIERFLGGDVDGAARLYGELIEPIAFQSSDEAPNPMPAKAILRAMGFPVGECRLPHGLAPEWLDERAEAVLADLESWRAQRRRPHAAEAVSRTA
jgi:4-hydroxy-tetrahydrodipicolinate synthase